MRLQGIKIRLTVLIGSLLVLSMLLVNFVLIIFWQRDALQREAIRDQAVLERLQQNLPGDLSTFHDLPPDFFAFAECYPKGETGQILVLSSEDDPVVFSRAEEYSPLLVRTITEAIQNNRPVRHYSGFFLGLFQFRRHLLVTAAPVICKGEIIGGIGISRSLESMFTELRRVEKIVLVYILINLLILSVVGFFRMRAIVVRPIERLVQLADRYSDQEAVLFAAESTGGEFGQLATSLNSMLLRIEHDRKSLEDAVEELAEVNRKLKKHQQEMIRTEKLASVGRMAAGLAHEIGNPLGVVQGYLDLLKRAENQTDAQQDFIRRAEQELQRVNALIRQMLDFARVSKGEPECIAVHELLNSVVEMVQVQPVFEAITLICRFEAELDTVDADRDQLRQVFVNALFNSADALQAAGRGSDGVITISTMLEKGEAEEESAGATLVIRISDNGVGISDEQLQLIFDPFYTTKEPGKGTGLGLSVSLSIIEAMGGMMNIQSSEGQDTVLSIYLPIKNKDEKR